MNDFRSWAHGSKCYEQLRVMDNLESYELRPLNAMNNKGLRMIWMIIGCEPMFQNAMNNLGLGMTWMTLGRVLKVLDAMNNSRL